MHFYDLGQDMIIEIMKNSGPDTLGLARANKYLYSLFKNNFGAINVISVVELICLIQFPRDKTNKILQFTSNLYPNHHLYITSTIGYIFNSNINLYVKAEPNSQINWKDYEEYYCHEIAMFDPKKQMIYILNYGSDSGPGCIKIGVIRSNDDVVSYIESFDVLHITRLGTLFENTFTFNLGPSWTYNKQTCEKYLSLLQNCKFAPITLKDRIKKHFIDLDRSFYWFKYWEWPEDRPENAQF